MNEVASGPNICRKRVAKWHQDQTKTQLFLGKELLMRQLVIRMLVMLIIVPSLMLIVLMPRMSTITACADGDDYQQQPDLRGSDGSS
jgi:hypothetical protein